ERLSKLQGSVYRVESYASLLADEAAGRESAVVKREQRIDLDVAVVRIVVVGLQAVFVEVRRARNDDLARGQRFGKSVLNCDRAQPGSAHKCDVRISAQPSLGSSASLRVGGVPDVG